MATLQTVLTFKIDGVEKSIATIGQLEKELNDVEKQLLDLKNLQFTQGTNEQLEKEIKNLESIQKILKTNAQVATKAANDEAKALKEVEEGQKKSAENLKNLSERADQSVNALDRARNGLKDLGDSGTSVGQKLKGTFDALKDALEILPGKFKAIGIAIAAVGTAALASFLATDGALDKLKSGFSAATGSASNFIQALGRFSISDLSKADTALKGLIRVNQDLLKLERERLKIELDISKLSSEASIKRTEAENDFLSIREKSTKLNQADALQQKANLKDQIANFKLLSALQEKFRLETINAKGKTDEEKAANSGKIEDLTKINELKKKDVELTGANVEIIKSKENRNLREKQQIIEKNSELFSIEIEKRNIGLEKELTDFEKVGGKTRDEQLKTIKEIGANRQKDIDNQINGLQSLGSRSEEITNKIADLQKQKAQANIETENRLLEVRQKNLETDKELENKSLEDSIAQNQLKLESQIKFDKATIDEQLETNKEINDAKKKILENDRAVVAGQIKLNGQEKDDFVKNGVLKNETFIKLNDEQRQKVIDNQNKQAENDRENEKSTQDLREQNTAKILSRIEDEKTRRQTLIDLQKQATEVQFKDQERLLQLDQRRAEVLKTLGTESFDLSKLVEAEKLVQDNIIKDQDIKIAKLNEELQIQEELLKVEEDALLKRQQFLNNEAKIRELTADEQKELKQIPQTLSDISKKGLTLRANFKVDKQSVVDQATDAGKAAKKEFDSLFFKTLSEGISKFGGGVSNIFTEVVNLSAQLVQAQVNELDKFIELTKEKIDKLTTAIDETRAREAQLEDNLANSRTEQREQILKGIEKQKKREAELQKQRQKALQDELAAEQKKRELLHEQAIKDKAAKIIAATTNTAVAVTAALAIPGAGFALATLAGILGALQIATIVATPIPEFSQGGFTQQHSDNKKPVGIVHSNEWVAPAHMVQSPKYRPIIQELESARLRGFETGGFTTNPVINVTNNMDQLTQTLSNFADAALALQDRPVIVSVKEVTDVQTSTRKVQAKATI